MAAPDWDARVATWLRALDERHLDSLRFTEVSRALRALSSAYVERRDRLARGAALDGGGKRAAFALFYGPLHFLTVREIVRRLPPLPGTLETIVDLGCGTGAAGAAWAIELGGRPRLAGVDRHHWAVAEAGWTYRTLALRGRTAQADAAHVVLPTRRTGIVLGWMVNELSGDGRAALLRKLLDAREHGASGLVIEPMARAAAPWWNEWAEVVESRGGSATEWRFEMPRAAEGALPLTWQRLGRAAGLSLRELTARSLWLPGSSRNAPRVRAAGTSGPGVPDGFRLSPE